MSNGKTNGSATPPAMPVAWNDFYKTNGHPMVVMPGGPSLTRQEFAEECDINAIMRRYDTVGAGPGGLPRDPNQPPMYVDFADLPQDLMGYLNFMKEAEASFMSLPAVVRREFDNNAVEFVGFASDPANLEQMREWGLAPPAKAPAAAAGGPSPAPAPAAAPPPGGASAPSGGSSTQ